MDVGVVYIEQETAEDDEEREVAGGGYKHAQRVDHRAMEVVDEEKESQSARNREPSETAERKEERREK